MKGIDIVCLEKNDFSDLTNQLKQMRKVARELDGPQQIPFKELFSTSFMATHTQCNSISDWFNSYEPFADTPDDEFDNITSTEGFNTYVVETTDFHSWEDMVNEATTGYISKKLGF